MPERDTDELVRLYRTDPGTPYDMTKGELQRLLAEVGEEEPVIDAILKLGGASSAERAEWLGVTTEDIDWDRPASEKFWRCEECGHEDRSRPLPPDREKFYARVQERGSPNCPKCKSRNCFMPVGF